jgi:hypothetical protein
VVVIKIEKDPALFWRLKEKWGELINSLPYRNPFMTSQWQGLAFEFFGGGESFYLIIIEGKRREFLGAVPIVVDEIKKIPRVSFTGPPDVTPYTELQISSPHRGEALPSLLEKIEQLNEKGVEFALSPLRDDSPNLWPLQKTFEEMGYLCSKTPTGGFYQIKIPESFDSFFYGLKASERKNLKKILDRAERLAKLKYRIYKKPKEVNEHLDDFFRLFTISGEEKRKFLTPGREAFYREIFVIFAREGRFELHVLEADGWKVGSLAVIDFGNTYYIYSIGEDPQAEDLKPKFLLIMNLIRNAMERKKKWIEIFEEFGERELRLGARRIQTFMLKAEKRKV